MTRRRAVLVVFVLLGAAVRLVEIERLPGINGDEAWYGVNVNELLHGGTPFIQTPSGNFVNPVHSLPLLLISTVVEPSFTVLRAPEVWWGIVTLAVTYPLLAKSIGRRAATLTTMLLAISPTAIVYSRIGWDPSGSPIVSLLAVALALDKRLVLAFLALLLAIIVHPTNGFLAPVMLAAGARHAAGAYIAASDVSKKRIRLWGAGAVFITVIIGAVLLYAAARMGRIRSLEMVMDTTFSLQAWATHGLAVLRLLSGTTAIQHTAQVTTSGAQSGADLAALVMLAIPVLFFPKSMRPETAWLGLGILASAVSFHVIAGPIAIEPSHERYILCLLVPLTIACALGIDAVWRRSNVTALILVIVAVGAFLNTMVRAYFIPLVTTGGNAHVTYRTGAIEPKQAAYDYVRSATKAGDVVAVFAEDWWIYWPVRYLAAPHRGQLFVEMVGNTPPVYAPGAARPSYPRRPDKAFAIVFHESGAWQQVRNLGHIAFTATDPIGRPILHVVALPIDRPLPFADPPPWNHVN